MRIQDHFSISVNLAGYGVLRHLVLLLESLGKYTAWAMLATASAQFCVPLGHSSLYFGFEFSGFSVRVRVRLLNLNAVTYDY